MSCGQHRLLGARGAAGAASVLLGLTDDVDCAVVNVSIRSRAPAVGSAAPGAGTDAAEARTSDAMDASGSASASASADVSASARASASASPTAGVSSSGGQAAAAGAPSAGDGQPGGPQIVVEHVSSIPALAYVAAGKVQRKHLLLGAPGASRGFSFVNIKA